MSPPHFGYAEYLYAVVVCFGRYDVKTKMPAGDGALFPVE